MNEFSDWQIKERDKRGWSQSELARRAHISQSQVSRVESGNSPGFDYLDSISRAFRYPLENVYRIAGLLYNLPAEDPRLAELNYLFEYLDEDDRQEIVDYARHRIRIGGQKGKYAAENMGISE